jgi:hypothetical protein
MDNMRLLILLIVVPVCMLCCNSCGLLCVDANLSPQALIEGNDYVILGEPISIDTLANLGTLDFLGSEENAFIVEYTFEPQEIFKGDKSTNYIYLWYCVTVRLKDDYTNAPECDTSRVLIYGNDICSWDSVIYLYTPNLVWAGKIPVLREWLNGIPPDSKWSAAKGDSTLMARIVGATHLEPILAQRNQTGQVIYATEEGYYTHDSFCRDDLVYCDWSWGFPQFTSQAGYVKRLRSLSR